MMTRHYTIQKGVPIPSKMTNDGAKSKYPWGDMEIGDSFSVPKEGYSSLHSQASYQSKRRRVRFTVRMCHTGARCWRTE